LPVVKSEPVAPLYSLMCKAYNDEGWTYEKIFPHIHALSASEVQTLVCIRESRKKVGTYTDGDPGYQLQWEVRLVQWSDGQVLDTATFVGGDPPVTKPEKSGPEYGNRPARRELVQWLFPRVGHEAVLFAGDNSVNGVFSPDGTLFATGSCATRDSKQVFCIAGEIRLWDIETMQIVRTLEGHTDFVSNVAFSPDGTLLASGSCTKREVKCIAGEVRVWDLESGQVIHTFGGQTALVMDVAFSPDGKLLASASLGGTGRMFDATVKLWDVKTGKEVHTLVHTSESFGSGVRSIAFSPDGQLLASGSAWDKTVKLWDVATGQEVRTLIGHQEEVQSVTFSPDGKILASASRDNTVKLWDVTNGRTIRTLEVFAWDVAFSPDGRFLATGEFSSDDVVKLWDVATGKVVRTLLGHTSGVTSVVFSPDGQILVSGSGSQDGTVRLWNIGTGQ